MYSVWKNADTFVNVIFLLHIQFGIEFRSVWKDI